MELQGTGEERPFTRKEHAQMLSYAASGIKKLIAAQKKALGGSF